MIRKALAGLAGLGLIGGAGTVVYNNHGDATVKVKDKTGQVQTVHLTSGGRATYSCPQGTHDKLEPHDIQIGRITLTLQHLRRVERKIEHRYPSGRAPGPVVDRYDALVSRDHRLVAAFNAEVDTHNGILERDCTAE